jgi:channel protein (hemolysin III family)
MRILQILDHVGIYLVIAGTYTPFLMGTLHKYTSASVLLIFEWIAAFLGGTFASKEVFMRLSFLSTDYFLLSFSFLS